MVMRRQVKRMSEISQMNISCYVNEHSEEDDVPEVFILADIESSQCESYYLL